VSVPLQPDARNATTGVALIALPDTEAAFSGDRPASVLAVMLYATLEEPKTNPRTNTEYSAELMTRLDVAVAPPSTVTEIAGVDEPVFWNHTAISKLSPTLTFAAVGN
jgi:hypothetical protein